MHNLLEVHERLGNSNEAFADALRVVLSHEQRDKGRLKVTSHEGDEVRIFLDRGQPLRVGEYLRSSCGRYLVVEGAQEAVVRAECQHWSVFSRACYHLGNRHVKVQLGHSHTAEGSSRPWLRILPDHVLEEMLLGLGMQLVSEIAVFNPEQGAYSHGHHHDH